MGKALAQDLAGLCWVGERHYSPASFTAEAERLGVSKRVAKVPKWLELGKTWLFLAHMKVFSEQCPACHGTPTPLERAAQGKTNRPEDCEECEGEGVIWTPGVFHAFVPKRLVKILADNAYPAEIERAKKAGFTVVLVPASDPDHQSRITNERGA